MQNTNESYNEWISVKDDLPDEDGEYLVIKNLLGTPCITTAAFCNDGYQISRANFDGLKNIFYKYDFESGWYQVMGVTHWMPLPSIPKEWRNESIRSGGTR